MAISLKHNKTSTQPDGTDTSLVQPSDWNAEHTLTLASSRLLGRTTAGTGNAEEISVGTGLTLAAGSLTANVTSVAGKTGAVTLAVADVSGAADASALNASNLTTGTVPNARLSGIYDGLSLKLTNGDTVFSTTSSGSTSTTGREVFGLANYRNVSATATGAIVFIAPAGTGSIMQQYTIKGLLYTAAQIVDFSVQGYRTTGAWSQLKKVNRGTVDVDVRFATTPAGNNCIILGDVATVWSYPHFVLSQALFSHTNATDAYCEGWTVALVTDLSTYTNITSVIADSPIVSDLTGNAVNVTGTVAVANGGTGATTAATARTNLGLGTAATAASSDFAAASHTHTIANVTGLQTALDNKQASLGYTPLNKAGDTATGNVYFSGGAEALTNAGNYGFRIRAKAAGNGILQFTDSGATAEWGSIYSTGSGNLQTGVRFYANNGLTTYGRHYSNEWIEFPNYSGLYSPLNTAHFYPNDGIYGSWRSRGSRNGWGGIEFSDASTTLMMNTDAYGFHYNNVGWRFYNTSGTGYFPGNVVAYWSDARLKENLRPIGAEALDILNHLTTYRFNWNERVEEFGLPIAPGKEEIGLIAQDVQQVLPDAVVVNKSANRLNDDGTTEERDYLTINYDRITPILVQAINELRIEINQLKAVLHD